jgi:hypothetical protein
MRCFNILFMLFAMALLPRPTVAQAALEDTTSAAFKTVTASTAYERSNFHQWLWGRNRRAEWATPIQVPVLWLDTACGGLTPYQQGGGNETRSLRLKSANGKEYSLRSINKSRTDVIPKGMENTFVEDIVRDGVSMAHPYGVTALPVMMDAAGIYHPNGIIVYVPEQAALDSFNDKFKNDLYLLEQRPDGDWSEAANLGNFKKFESTADVIEKMLKSNKNIADQRAFVKARLFDMLVSDWDRHEDNWRWGESESGDKTTYTPVARDRDQVFYARDGILLNFMIKAAKLTYMQDFDHTIKDVPALNWEMRHIDRFFTNALALDDWLLAAKDLQRSLTDTVIAQSLRQLPAPVFEVSGKELIEKLKSRRDKLHEYAADYYRFLATEVVIPGSNEREYFDVKRLDAGKTEVAVFRISEKGETEAEPYYRRTFIPGETKEIRIFGKDGHDEYNVKEGSKKIKVNVFDTTPAYKYKWYEYNYKGFGPDISYNNNDRLYVGIKYKSTNNRWNKSPFASRYEAGVRYSISQNALSAYGKALYPELIGKWDFSLEAEYDAIRWTNFYGMGNESKMLTKEFEFHRLRSKEWLATLGFTRRFGNNRISLAGFYQEVQNKNDTDRYVAKVYHFVNPDVYALNRYAGLQVAYAYRSLNDSIVPVKGIDFRTSGTFSNNIYQKEFFQKYEADLRAFLPLTKHISFALRAGGATVVNDNVLNSAQLYQHAIIGGGRSLRGYRRERFWGQTAYYNQNELRFITDFRSKIMSGKIGVFGFFDNGRVWMPGENSNKTHVGYGPGLLLAPFNKISATITYSMSEELKTIQVRIDSKF